MIVDADDDMLMKSINKLGGLRRSDKIQQRDVNIFKYGGLRQGVRDPRTVRTTSKEFSDRAKEDLRIVNEITTELETYFKASNNDYDADTVAAKSYTSTKANQKSFSKAIYKFGLH